MARNYKTLSELTSDRDDYTIKVRLTRMWDGINLSTGQIVNTTAILLDEEDNHVMLILRLNQRAQYMKKLDEDDVYVISNFKIVPAPPRYKAISGDKVINFFHKTTITQVNNTDIIARYKFELSTFDETIKKAGDKTHLIDVIGQLTTISDLQTVGQGIQKLDIVLTNESHHTITVTMWGEQALNFQRDFSIQNDNLIVVVVTGTLAKEFRGEVNLSSTVATRVYFNIPYQPVSIIRSSIQNNEGMNSAIEIVPKIQLHKHQQNYSTERLCIDQLLNAKLPQGSEFIYCTCEVTIDDIVFDQGWYYLACNKCLRKIKDPSSKLQCQNCLDQEIGTTQRYKVTVKVKDNTGETTFVLFNREAAHLIGVPIDHLINERKELTSNSDISMQDIPPAIYNICKKNCLFQIKITPYNTERGYEEYTVSKVEELKPVPKNPTQSQTSPSQGNKKKQKITVVTDNLVEHPGSTLPDIPNINLSCKIPTGGKDEETDDAIERLCIKQLLNVKLPEGSDFKYCTCEVTILDILLEQGWYYVTCNNCLREIKELSTKFQCQNCLGEQTENTKRYKLTIKVKDITGETTFIMLNREAAQLIGVSIEQLINDVNKESPQAGINMQELPPAIHNICGKNCLLQIKITPYNTELGYEEYTVSKVLNIKSEVKSRETKHDIKVKSGVIKHENNEKSNDPKKTPDWVKKNRRKIVDFVEDLEEDIEVNSEEDKIGIKHQILTPAKNDKRAPEKKK